ncbi:DgyrCDS11049 [Dimorphilus gyrociliatus]|uniref:DgyrCDS11049 n=1 Tax=Dimorphilus gyrociliatus TaxID=2664684 RepID=A0A7I8W770_9ANNE|nr:DgyrCDS11049 [Dimorphilus gyrociliatus]
MLLMNKALAVCQTFDVQLSNRSIEVISQPLTWRRAVKTCRSRGGMVWEVKNDSERSFSAAILEIQNISTMWLGANIKKSLRWNGEDDMSKYNYTAWKSEYKLKKVMCVASDVNENYDWSWEDCTSEYPFFCQHTVTANISEDTGFCNNDKQTLVEDKCLTFHIKKLSFFRAFEVCSEDGGSLIVINKPLHKISNFYKLMEPISKTINRFWIGLSNSWFNWKGSGSLLVYQAWGDSYPSSSGKCLAITKNKDTDFWLNKDCKMQLPFVCSYETSTNCARKKTKGKKKSNKDDHKTFWDKFVDNGMWVAIGIGICVLLVIMFSALIACSQGQKFRKSSRKRAKQEKHFRTFTRCDSIRDDQETRTQPFAVSSSYEELVPNGPRTIDFSNRPLPNPVESFLQIPNNSTSTHIH